MGCIPSTKFKPQDKPSQISSRQISITPGTFTRKTSCLSYSDYIELQDLGSGAFAEVKLCLHRPTKTQRAVKLIHRSGLDASQKDPQFLLKEFHILRNLDHPNILKCFEIFEDQRLYYISTEYCPAGDLFTEILKFKKFTEAQAANIIQQLLSALVYCHSKRVIHRDLKPENILLMEKGEELSIKVADFGNSVILDASSKLKGCFGSAYYLAPEIFQESYNEKCDIWSVGIILYILLTGKPPYSGKDSDSIVDQIKNSPFRLTPPKCTGLSPDAIDLLKKLLKPAYNLRIAAKEAVVHPWITKNQSKQLPDTELALTSLKSFHCHSKLKEAVHTYLASQISTYEDTKYFKNCFRKIDKNSDGKITKEELVAEYSNSMTVQEAEKVSSEIIERLDQDQDGMIDYTEFLVSCSERQKNLSLEKLEIAFNMFDVDRSGTISAEEIKSVLNNGQVDDEDTWKEILKEADSNGDGFIDLKEFLHLMSTSLQSSLSLKLVKSIERKIVNR